jgi:integrase/recombinase XerD
VHLAPPVDPPHPLSLTTTDQLERAPAAVYLAHLAPASRRVMRGALDRIAALLTDGQCDARTLDWARLTYAHTSAVRAVLVSSAAAPATCNRYLAALRGVPREAWRLGQLPVAVYQRAIDLPPARGSRLPRGRALPRADLQALFDTVSSDARSASGARDAALLGLLYGAGLRRAELVALDLADYDRVADSLRIQGKGNRQRLAYLAPGARAALEDWLLVRGDAPGPLFWPVLRSGRLAQQRRITPQAVLYVARRRSLAARIQNFSPHDLRRSFVSDLLDAGTDLSTVQQLAGHAQVQTTARYDRRGEPAKRSAASRLHVPYSSRPQLSRLD